VAVITAMAEKMAGRKRFEKIGTMEAPATCLGYAIMAHYPHFSKWVTRLEIDYNPLDERE
jgi:hypothetical protein